MIDVIADIGFRHRGNISEALSCLRLAKDSGCTIFKIPRRTLRTNFTKFELSHRDKDGKTLEEKLIALQLSDVDFKRLRASARVLGIKLGVEALDGAALESILSFEVDYVFTPPINECSKSFIEHFGVCQIPTIVTSLKSPISKVTKTINRILNVEGILAGLMYGQRDMVANPLRANLRTLSRYFDLFRGLPLGYTSREPGTTVAVVAMARGIGFIEKPMLPPNWMGPKGAGIFSQDFAYLSQLASDLSAIIGDGKDEQWLEDVRE